MILGFKKNKDSHWFSNAILNDTFDWAKSFKTTFEIFLKYVSLHDSYFVIIKYNATNEIIISIELDAYWNSKYTLKTREIKDWPYLIIKIQNVFNISLNSLTHETIIDDASTENISKNEIDRLIGPLTDSMLFPQDFYNRIIDCKEIVKTRFEDILGGNIEFLHEPDIYVLLIEKNGCYIDPNIDRLNPIRR